MPLNGVVPNVEALAAGRYPLSKSFYMVTKVDLSVGAQKFIEFMKSPAGQDILRRTGHVPNE